MPESTPPVNLASAAVPLLTPLLRMRVRERGLTEADSTSRGRSLLSRIDYDPILGLQFDVATTIPAHTTTNQQGRVVRVPASTQTFTRRAEDLEVSTPEGWRLLGDVAADSLSTLVGQPVQNGHGPTSTVEHVLAGPRGEVVAMTSMGEAAPLHRMTTAHPVPSVPPSTALRGAPPQIAFATATLRGDDGRAYEVRLVHGQRGGSLAVLTSDSPGPAAVDPELAAQVEAITSDVLVPGERPRAVIQLGIGDGSHAVYLPTGAGPDAPPYTIQTMSDAKLQRWVGISVGALAGRAQPRGAEQPATIIPLTPTAPIPRPAREAGRQEPVVCMVDGVPESAPKFPYIRGTVAQVRWALQLRAGMATDLLAMRQDSVQRLRSGLEDTPTRDGLRQIIRSCDAVMTVQAASWWIDNRGRGFENLVRQVMMRGLPHAERSGKATAAHQRAL